MRMPYLRIITYCIHDADVLLLRTTVQGTIHAASGDGPGPLLISLTDRIRQWCFALPYIYRIRVQFLFFEEAYYYCRYLYYVSFRFN